MDNRIITIMMLLCTVQGITLNAAEASESDTEGTLLMKKDPGTNVFRVKTNGEGLYLFDDLERNAMNKGTSEERIHHISAANVKMKQAREEIAYAKDNYTFQLRIAALSNSNETLSCEDLRLAPYALKQALELLESEIIPKQKALTLGDDEVQKAIINLGIKIRS